MLIFFVGVNENSTTLLYTFEKGGQENGFLEREKKVSFPLFQKCIKKSKCQQQKIWNWVSSFMYLVSVYPMNRTQVQKLLYKF